MMTGPDEFRSLEVRTTWLQAVATAMLTLISWEWRVTQSGLPGCLKVMIRKGSELFNQSPDPARRRRRVAKGKGNWSVTTA